MRAKQHTVQKQQVYIDKQNDKLSILTCLVSVQK